MDATASFEAFKAAGLALDATWQPSIGGPQQSAVVLLDVPDEMLLDSALAGQQVMEYRSTQFVGLATGETVTISGTDYLVRETPRRLYDGAILRAWLTPL